MNQPNNNEKRILNIHQAEIQTKLENNGWLKNNENVWTSPERTNKHQVSWPPDSYEENTYKENFWSKARADLIMDTCKYFKVKELLEIGSGHGNVSIPLMKEGLEMIALEPILSGAQQTASYGITTINGTLDSIKDLSFTFSAIGIFDVLEHIENPKDFITNIRSKQDSGGIIILTVPAHNWLYSDFDLAIGHHRRYTKKGLQDEMQSAGYQEIHSRHFFLTLVLPAFFFRRIPYLLGRRREFAGEGGVKQEIGIFSKLNRKLDELLYITLRLESRVRFPVGLSILGVYKKI